MRALIWCAVSTRTQSESDKMSLPQQEADARALCVSKGWNVVDVLVVPGHSRYVILEFEKLVAAAMKKGIPAFAKLRQHWETRDFDVLIIRDGDRLARAQGLLGTIVESVIQSGAIIWSMNDGEPITIHNYRFWTAMTGFRAAAHVDNLVKMRDQGLTRKIQNGRPLTAQVADSHKLVRDERGQPHHLIVNDAMQPVIQDAAKLVLEGIGWQLIEHELKARYGYQQSSGAPLKNGKFYRLFHNPIFWGHTARRQYQSRSKNSVMYRSAWAFDESIAPPTGALIVRNTHPPALTGNLAEDLKLEMKRRLELKGHASSRQGYRFTGLLICGSCKLSISYINKKLPTGNLSRAMRCKYASSSRFATCDNRGQILEQRVFESVDDTLQKILEGKDLATLAQAEAGASTIQTIDYAAQIRTLEESARVFIIKQGEHPELSSIYDAELSRIGAELTIARQRSAEQVQDIPLSSQDFGRTRDMIAEMGLEAFWNLPAPEVNRYLRSLFSGYKFVMLEKKVVRIVRYP